MVDRLRALARSADPHEEHAAHSRVRLDMGSVMEKYVPQRLRGTTMTTSKKDASAASKQLKNPKSTKAEKAVAGSDLSQAKGGGGAKKKKKKK